jgi:hypothetical protein
MKDTQIYQSVALLKISWVKDLGVGGVAQAVEHLSSKPRALSTNPSTTLPPQKGKI